MNHNSNSQQSIEPGISSANYGNPNPQYLQEEKSVNWRKYLYIFLRNWYWFLITLSISLGIAFFKIRYSIPEYQASTTLIIENEENSQDMVSQLRAVRFWRRQADLANETAKLKAFTLIKRTVDSLNQEVFWTAHGRIRVRPLYDNPRFKLTNYTDSINWPKEKEWFVEYIDEKKYRLYHDEIIDTILPLDSIITINNWKFSNNLISESGHTVYSFVIKDLISLSKHYKRKLKVNFNEENGTIIYLQSAGPVGGREVDFLNTLSQIYILSELERKQSIAENTFQFIDNQIKVILDSLSNAETQLITFQLTNNVINLSREGEIAYDRLKNFHEQRTVLKLKESYYDYLREYIEERKNPQAIIVPTLTDGGDPLLIGAVQDLQQLYQERETLDLSAQENNPGFESINERILGVRDRIIEIVKGLIENNQLTLRQLDIEERAILNQIKTLPVNEQQLLNIKRKYDLYNQFYTFLLQKRAESGIQKASTISNARILDPARLDHLVLVGKDEKYTLLLALIFGIFTPAAILILRGFLDNRIREKDDILNLTNIPILGVIGHANSDGISLVKNNSNSAFTEALRHIRTNLAFAIRDHEQKVIMITSSVSGEGKTFSAANLAAIIALNNRKVLLMGCDMRKPTLHKVFNISNDNGLSSYIIGESTYEDITLPTPFENLFVMPAGPIPPNPAELIETKQMGTLFQKAKKEYDYIIVDTPPIALVSDALSIASYADISIFVIRQNQSHKGVLDIVNSLSNENKLPRTYLLVNDILPSRSLGMNYYYGYGKGYNYGYNDYSYQEHEQD